MLHIIDQEKINAGKKDWQIIAVDKPYCELVKPKGLEHWHSINAHPNGLFIIETEKTVKICGYLNSRTAKPNPLSPVEVRIAEMIIGYLYLPGNVTHTVHLPPGKYEVRVHTNSLNHQHVYLLFNDADAP